MDERLQEYFVIDVSGCLPSIRVATTADAALLTEFCARVFWDAFHADNSPDDMHSYMREAFTVPRLTEELSDPMSTFLLAEIDSKPVGYAKLMAGDPDEAITGSLPIEIVRLYADANYIGKGVGSSLMQACHDTAKASGYQTLWLGVWEHNHRAIAFYRKWGFVPVGSHVFQLGSDPQTDLIMQKSLADIIP